MAVNSPSTEASKLHQIRRGADAFHEQVSKLSETWPKLPASAWIRVIWASWQLAPRSFEISSCNNRHAMNMLADITYLTINSPTFKSRFCAIESFASTPYGGRNRQWSNNLRSGPRSGQFRQHPNNSRSEPPFRRIRNYRLLSS